MDTNGIKQVAFHLWHDACDVWGQQSLQEEVTDLFVSQTVCFPMKPVGPALEYSWLISSTFS